jgi:hypothetical protein
MHFCAALPDQNAAGRDHLAAEAFYAETLRIAVTPVA